MSNPRNLSLSLVAALLLAAFCASAQAAAQAPISAQSARPIVSAAAYSARPARAHAASRRQTVRVCTTRSVERDGHTTRHTSCHTTTRRKPAAKPRAKRPSRGNGNGNGNVTSSASAAAAALASTIAKVLATPCQNTQLIPEAADLALVRASVLCLINTERAQNGREPLQSNPRLEAAAESHGKEMIALDYFDHIAPSGETPVERIRTTGYIPSSEVGYVIGENLAWGTLTLATPEAIVKAWIASPEHLANILEGKYRETGIDVRPEVPEELAGEVEGALYTQEFGVIVH